MVDKYDLIVIGSGAAAQTVVYDCAAAGWNVALIEERLIGGTCALRGCIPKKVLVGVAETISRIHDLKGKGIAVENDGINWSALIKFKKSFTDNKPEVITKSLKQAGIDIFHGHASFIDEKTIEVDGKRFVSTYFFIATGAIPRPLEFPGSEFVITSDDFFNLNQLPDSIAFIGGGFISFELAHIAARAGCKVTILHRSSQPLKQFDRDLVEMLLMATKDIGINVRTNMAVHAVEKTNGGFQVIAGDDNEKISANLVIHGAGRIPNIKGLSLDRANVSFSKKGIEVNDYMQSISNPAVFAAGDVSASGLPLTPVAGAEGRVVLKNLLKKDVYPSTISHIPSTLFTIPPLSSVGLTEVEVEEKGLDVRINTAESDSWFTSKRIGLKHAGFKILIDEKRNQLVGAHLLGNHAEEIINVFALAMKQQITVDQLKDMVWSYPTSTYDINYMI